MYLNKRFDFLSFHLKAIFIILQKKKKKNDVPPLE